MTTAFPVEPPSIPSAPRTLYATRIKRLLDILVSAIALVLLLPVMAIVAAAVRLVLGPPVLFHDERAGLNGHKIWIAKFRSMSNATDETGALLADADRLGTFGRLLRRTSLDELPQFVSVLVGDMSLVGPRPLPMRYVPRYSPRQASRLLVRPGLTGRAQIHGRNAVDWPERLEHDARYVEILGGRKGACVDFQIMGSTALMLLTSALNGRGISANGCATMPEFMP